MPTPSKAKPNTILCADCKQPIKKFVGARSEWWIHEKSRNQTCQTGMGGIAKPETERGKK